MVENGSLILTWHSKRLCAPHVPEAEAPVSVSQRAEVVEEEPEGFPPNHDQAAQAQALQRAAISGAPFCEECEKARQELLAQQQLQQPQPAPAPAKKQTPVESGEPGQFPAGHDQDAQARVLEAAAAEGVPFCEECEKAGQSQRAEEEEMAV